MHVLSLRMRTCWNWKMKRFVWSIFNPLEFNLSWIFCVVINKYQVEMREWNVNQLTMTWWDVVIILEMLSIKVKCSLHFNEKKSRAVEEDKYWQKNCNFILISTSLHEINTRDLIFECLLLFSRSITSMLSVVGGNEIRFDDFLKWTTTTHSK
jgi:hypothetical protein